MFLLGWVSVAIIGFARSRLPFGAVVYFRACLYSGVAYVLHCSLLLMAPGADYVCRLRAVSFDLLPKALPTNWHESGSTELPPILRSAELPLLWKERIGSSWVRPSSRLFCVPLRLCFFGALLCSFVFLLLGFVARMCMSSYLCCRTASCRV